MTSTRINPLDLLGTPAPAKSTPLAALKAAGCDFEVEKVPLYASSRDRGDFVGEVTGYWGIRRNDTGYVIGIGQGQYTPIQNSQYFGDVAGTMIEESGARITRCGSYDGGAKVFMNLEWPSKKDINVLGDIVRRRCCIFTTHNGEQGARTILQPLRLACLNGMVVPVPGATFDIVIFHTKRADGRIRSALRVLKQAGRYFDAFHVSAEILAQTKVGPRKAEKIIKLIADPNDKAEKRNSGVVTAPLQRINRVTALFEGMQSNGKHKAVYGTGYGILQAFIEDADYGSRVRKAKGASEEEQRFKAAMIGGTSSKEKLRVWTALVRELDLETKMARAAQAVLN